MKTQERLSLVIYSHLNQEKQCYMIYTLYGKETQIFQKFKENFLKVL